MNWTQISVGKNASYVDYWNVNGYYNSKLKKVHVFGRFTINAAVNYKNALFGIDSAYIPDHTIPIKIFNANNFTTYNAVVIGKLLNTEYIQGNVRLADNITLPFPVFLYVDFEYLLL